MSNETRGTVCGNFIVSGFPSLNLGYWVVPDKRKILTFVSISDTLTNLAIEGRLRPRVLTDAERVRALAEPYSPLPGSFRHHALRHYGRCVGCTTGLGQAGVGNPHLATARAAASQEAWPGAERKGRKPPGESRGGTPTGERARSAFRWQHLHAWREPHPMVRRMDYAPAGVPLPFSFVVGSPDGAQRNPGRTRRVTAFPAYAAAPSGLRILQNRPHTPRERVCYPPTRAVRGGG